MSPWPRQAVRGEAVALDGGPLRGLQSVISIVPFHVIGSLPQQQSCHERLRRVCTIARLSGSGGPEEEYY